MASLFDRPHIRDFVRDVTATGGIAHCKHSQEVAAHLTDRGRIVPGVDIVSTRPADKKAAPATLPVPAPK